MNEITRETIIRAAKDAAAEEGGTISRADFQRITGISQNRIYDLFPDGGWTEVRHAADIPRHPKDNEPLTDDELLAEFHRVSTECGEIPTWPKLNAKASVHADTIKKRFRGWPGTLERYRSWLEENDPASHLLADLQARLQNEITPPPPVVSLPACQVQPQWPKGDGIEYGAPISFRGHQHAPTNEQGVVYFFGMVSCEIGIIMEAIRASYPDCEAKRCVDAKRNRWQRVWIEFEYQSRNFHEHGHDPSKCDLIVCWEHNWSECPIEVIELRKVIDRLAER